MLPQRVPRLHLRPNLEARLLRLAGGHVEFLQHRADVHEPRDRRAFLVLVDEQVGPQRAVRVATEVRGKLAAERADQLGKRRHAGEREPVVVRVADAGLLA